MTDNAQLLQAYSQAKYVVQANVAEFILRVGEASAELDQHLQQHNAKMAAFITPENPFSEVLTEEQNEKLHQQFKADLKARALVYTPAYGVDDAEQWPREKSYLVFIEEVQMAEELAQQYQQNGWLLCTVGQPMLLKLRDGFGG